MEPWRRLDVNAEVHIAGLRTVLTAEMFDPAEIRFVAVADQARVAYLLLTMSARGADAVLPPGTALDVFTVAGFRGIGIARLLWPWATLVCAAEKLGLRPLHSPSRTEAGQAYAEDVGGYIPPLAGGRYIECPAQFDPATSLWRNRQHLDLKAVRASLGVRCPMRSRLSANVAARRR